MQSSCNHQRQWNSDNTDSRGSIRRKIRPFRSVKIRVIRVIRFLLSYSCDQNPLGPRGILRSLTLRVEAFSRYVRRGRSTRFETVSRGCQTSIRRVKVRCRLSSEIAGEAHAEGSTVPTPRRLLRKALPLHFQQHTFGRVLRVLAFAFREHDERMFHRLHEGLRVNHDFAFGVTLGDEDAVQANVQHSYTVR